MTTAGGVANGLAKSDVPDTPNLPAI